MIQHVRKILDERVNHFNLHSCMSKSSETAENEKKTNKVENAARRLDKKKANASQYHKNYINNVAQRGMPAAKYRRMRHVG